MAKKARIPHKFLPWIDARKKFRLSNAHIQMARELGLSPKRFAVYADVEGQPWKVPLPEFIEQQYLKQFGKERPEVILSIEEIAAAHVAKRAARKTRNKQAASEESTEDRTVTGEPPMNEPESQKMTAAESDPGESGGSAAGGC